MSLNSSKRWLALTAAAAVVGLLASCSGTPAAKPTASSSSGSGAVSTDPVTLTYVSYGGTGQQAQIDAWQKPYTALHPNVTFVNSSPPDPAQVKAQVTTGSVQWNIVTTAPYLATQNCGTLYEKLTIPNLDKSQFSPGTIGECYVTDFKYSLVFSYNADKWPDPATAPKTLADFFNTKKFPGKRGVVPTVQDGFLEIALLADGVKANKLYPLDVTRALSEWDKVKSDTVFAANPGALLQAITSKQVDMQILVQARSQAVLDAGVNAKAVWSQTLTSIDGLAIPKGAPNKEAAEQFISFLLQPEQSAKMASLAGVAPSNNKAVPTYTERGNLVNAFGKANTGTNVQANAAYWGEHYNQVQAQVTAWLNG
ncbi:extracellular solute-binding protein [Lacisediminihabitans profunda]|nr:extracellular solute-binding protein [Lacisediminihabitans profunda]